MIQVVQQLVLLEGLSHPLLNMILANSPEDQTHALRNVMVIAEVGKKHCNWYSIGTFIRSVTDLDERQSLIKEAIVANWRARHPNITTKVTDINFAEPKKMTPETLQQLASYGGNSSFTRMILDSLPEDQAQALRKEIVILKMGKRYPDWSEIEGFVKSTPNAKARQSLVKEVIVGYWKMNYSDAQIKAEDINFDTKAHMEQLATQLVSGDLELPSWGSDTLFIDMIFAHLSKDQAQVLAKEVMMAEWKLNGPGTTIKAEDISFDTPSQMTRLVRRLGRGYFKSPATIRHLASKSLSHPLLSMIFAHLPEAQAQALRKEVVMANACSENPDWHEIKRIVNDDLVGGSQKQRLSLIVPLMEAIPSLSQTFAFDWEAHQDSPATEGGTAKYREHLSVFLASRILLNISDNDIGGSKGKVLFTQENLEIVSKSIHMGLRSKDANALKEIYKNSSQLVGDYGATRVTDRKMPLAQMFCKAIKLSSASDSDVFILPEWMRSIPSIDEQKEANGAIPGSAQTQYSEMPKGARKFTKYISDSIAQQQQQARELCRSDGVIAR